VWFVKQVEQTVPGDELESMTERECKDRASMEDHLLGYLMRADRLFHEMGKEKNTTRLVRLVAVLFRMVSLVFISPFLRKGKYCMVHSYCCL
jgi:hypothetical protein